MPIHDPWHHQAGGALLSHQHHCPLDVSKTLKGTKAATFERQPHIGRHSCHHLDPLPCPTSLCPCPCQIMQGVTMLCALLLDVSCAEHIVHIISWCSVHRSTLPLGRQRTTSTTSSQCPAGTRTRPATRYFFRYPTRPDSVLEISGYRVT